MVLPLINVLHNLHIKKNLGAADELLAAMYHYNGKLLVVVYKEDETDGFILTAYFTGKTEKLFKRTILWQK